VTPGAPLGFADTPAPEDRGGDIAMLRARGDGSRADSRASAVAAAQRGMSWSLLWFFNFPMGTAIRSNLFIKS
jgi:hypothetical protein